MKFTFKMTKIIVVTSGKGGVGKTTTAINLGAALNYFGENVLIVDANLSTPNIGVNLGSPEVPVHLNHVINEKADIFEAIYEHESGMKVMPSSLSIKELENIKTEKLKNLKRDFKEVADYVIVDSAAGLGKEARDVIELADEIIIVTNPEIAALTDALKTIKVAESIGKPILGVIVSRVRKDQIELQPSTVKEMLEVPVIGMIPEDISVKKSLNFKDAVVHTHPKSRAARAYKEIAAKIAGVEYDSDKEKPTIIEIILRRY